MFIPPWETPVQTKTCRVSGEEFVVTDKDMQFLRQVAPSIWGEVVELPTPDLCPAERAMRRMVWRNELELYHRKCDLTWKDIISVFSPDKMFVVYGQEAWWSDEWSPFEYGRKVDFERPFFDQFQELLHVVPLQSSVVINSENSSFTSYCAESKDCYMSVRLGESRDIYYTYYSIKSDTCIDCVYILNCHHCYQSVDCEECHQSMFSRNCKNCRDIWYCKDCVWCSDCFLCFGLRNQKYCFQNKQYEPQEYEKLIGQIKTEDPQKVFDSMLTSIPQKQHTNIACENCYGDHLHNCEDLFWAFDSYDLKIGKYITGGGYGEYQFDTDFGYHGSHTYDAISMYHGSNVLFSHGAYRSSFVLYSYLINNAQNVFGSVGLKTGTNIILNTSYSEQEYWTLSKKLVEHMRSTGEWGQFFPPSLAPFGYNETVAQIDHPISKEEVLKRGYSWHDQQKDGFSWIPYAPLPIDQFDEALVGPEKAKQNISECLSGTIVCEKTGRPFRLLPKELAFYIENKLSIPTLAPEVRRNQLMQVRNPHHLWERKCSKCGKDIYTTYASDRKERVYCEECYRKEVY